ncbi:2'-5' RNA ligase family protein [Luteococcus sp. H138]|uniref:2'-5' RNA ligase family protein n=1 Tax=unclassified Luteococcus TaxID=2639923 RepID=UPI00313CE8A4
MTRWPGHAVLQVPVPPLEPYVRGRYHFYDPSLLGVSDLPGIGFVHAHVTVLGLFDELPDPGDVASVAGRMTGFDAHCRRVRAFPNGIIHCPAEPAEGFGRLHDLARAAFPGIEPYRGHYDVDPHVTLDAVGVEVSVRSVARELSGVLPVTFRAEALDLVWYEQGRTRLLGRWGLG